MASATNSAARSKPRSVGALLQPVAQAAAQHPVPLLVLRLPQLERMAWLEGKRAARRFERATTNAFIEACSSALRKGDLIAHDPGNDVFIVAMIAPSRASRVPSPIDCRSALERIAGVMSLHVETRIETGWTLVRSLDSIAGLAREIETALERGARERERYEFFAAIGHELRTPLTSIRGYLETLIEGRLDETTRRRFLETTQRETLRMARLLDGMFEFSLLDLSAGALISNACALGHAIDLACEVVAPAAMQRGITVRKVNCAEVSVGVDGDACLQLLVNLLENAIKYGRDGGVVSIAASARADVVTVYVDDDGPGVSPAERESIFGLRVRGAQSAARPGTGIGLAIVKMIAERAGGSIRATDSPLGGARFEVTLALRDNVVLAS